MRYTGAGWVDDGGELIELPAEPLGDGIGPIEREPDIIAGVEEEPDPREVRKATRDRRERKST